MQHSFLRLNRSLWAIGGASDSQARQQRFCCPRAWSSELTWLFQRPFSKHPKSYCKRTGAEDQRSITPPVTRTSIGSEAPHADNNKRRHTWRHIAIEKQKRLAVCHACHRDCGQSGSFVFVPRQIENVSIRSNAVGENPPQHLALQSPSDEWGDLYVYFWVSNLHCKGNHSWRDNPTKLPNFVKIFMTRAVVQHL